MLLDSLAGPLGIGVEGHQPLGLAAVAEPLLHDGRDERAVVGARGEQGLQLGPEGEAADVLHQRVDALAALALVDELEELLEHARGGARRGDELHDRAAGGVVAGHGAVGSVVVEGQDAVGGRCGAHDFQEGKSAAESGDLPFDRFGSESVVGYLLQILFGKHNSSGFRFLLSKLRNNS